MQWHQILSFHPYQEFIAQEFLSFLCFKLPQIEWLDMQHETDNTISRYPTKFPTFPLKCLSHKIYINHSNIVHDNPQTIMTSKMKIMENLVSNWVKSDVVWDFEPLEYRWIEGREDEYSVTPKTNKWNIAISNGKASIVGIMNFFYDCLEWQYKTRCHPISILRFGCPKQ